ncbi:MAG: ATP synthase F0 subunit B [Clostridia bacterium]
MAALKDIFDLPNPATFIISLCNIAMLIGVLYFLLFKKIKTVLEERQAIINKDLVEAAAARESAALNKIYYEEKIKNARADAQDIIVRAGKVMEELRKEKTAQAQLHADDILRKARIQITEDEKRSMAKIEREAASMARTAAEQILADEARPGMLEEGLAEFVKKVGM